MLDFLKKEKNDPNKLTGIISELLSLQSATHGRSLNNLASTLAAHQPASGYVFGFHDCAVQRFGIYDEKNPELATLFIKENYQRLFGKKAGLSLYKKAIYSEDESLFSQGRIDGGTDFHEFLANQTPPLGLSRILSKRG